MRSVKYAAVPVSTPGLAPEYSLLPYFSAEEELISPVTPACRINFYLSKLGLLRSGPYLSTGHWSIGLVLAEDPGFLDHSAAGLDSEHPGRISGHRHLSMPLLLSEESPKFVSQKSDLWSRLASSLPSPGSLP